MKKIIELDQYETFQPYVAEVKPLTPEQLQIEYMFIRAELFTRSLLICGMISCEEFDITTVVPSVFVVSVNVKYLLVGLFGLVHLVKVLEVHGQGVEGVGQKVLTKEESNNNWQN